MRSLFFISILFLCTAVQSALSQSTSTDTMCFHRLFSAAESFEAQDSFIRAISHYDAARACPDVTGEQDALARSRARDARVQWEQQLLRQISIADKARAEAEDSAQSAMRARAFAIEESERAIRAQKAAVRNARASEAGRLALEADEETDVLLSTNSADERRKNDALMAAYWAMRWAGDTLQTEVTRAFGNAVFLTDKEEYPGKGAMGVEYDSKGRSYLMSYSGGTTVLANEAEPYALPANGYTRQVIFDADRNEVITVNREEIRRWTEGSSSLKGQAIPVLDELGTEVVFSEETGLYASGNRDGSVNVWSDPARIRRMKGHTAPVTHIAFSPVSKTGEATILTSSKDKTARIWTSTGSSIGTPPLADHIIRSSYLNEEKVVLVSGSNVIIWDVNDANFEDAVTLRHEHVVADVMSTSDAREVITLEFNGVAHRWTLTGDKTGELPLFGSEAIGLMRLSGQKCAAWNRNGNIAFFDDDMARLELPLNAQNDLQNVVVSPSGKYFITTGSDGSLALWDEDGIEWMSPPRFDGFVWAAGFSPDETEIWASSKSGRQEIVWICPMPNLKYSSMRDAGLKPNDEQARRFKMRLAIPDN